MPSRFTARPRVGGRHAAGRIFGCVLVVCHGPPPGGGASRRRAMVSTVMVVLVVADPLWGAGGSCV